MQTFLPYPDFIKTAQVLDRSRLGKQRLEAKGILRILIGETPDSRWRFHPAVKMWQGHTGSLARYGKAICDEWIKRGYVDNQLPFFQRVIAESTEVNNPEWLGNSRFHASHRSNLLRKKPQWYNQFNWVESPDMEYVWPSKENI